ncbi:hypothetical protein B8T70_04230 [Flavobacterium sp. AJR]|nr:hypothetical protein B8T70_04230 [Flavobacterium sp. AJR]
MQENGLKKSNFHTHTKKRLSEKLFSDNLLFIEIMSFFLKLLIKKVPAGRYIYSNFNCNQKKPHRGGISLIRWSLCLSQNPLDIYSNLKKNQYIATL